MQTAEPNSRLKLIARASRHRLFHRIAASLLRSARAGERVPRFVRGTVNGRAIDLDLDEMVDQRILLFGMFDSRGLGLLKKVAAAISCCTVLDVGANIGNHVAFFSDWAKQVVAVEPNPPVYERLAKFVAENGLSNVTTVPVGLSDRTGEMTFYTVPGRAHLASLEMKHRRAIVAGRVPVEPGDALLARLGIRNVDLVKIDVEGHEREVLRGLQKTISGSRPVVALEWTDLTRSKFETPESLRRELSGYELFGTSVPLSSRLFKTAYGIEPFDFAKKYVHVLCLPAERKSAVLAALA